MATTAATYGFIGGLIIFLAVAGIIIIKYTDNRHSLLKFQRTAIPAKQKTNLLKWAKIFGINEIEYQQMCRILRIEPEYTKLIITRCSALVVFAVGLLVGVTTLNIIILLFSIIATLALLKLPMYKVESEAKKQIEEFSSELPRFLDLLTISLNVGTPITEAIKKVAQNVGGVLGEELLECLAENEIGASSWQQSLIGLARVYNDTDFSDFVIDLISSYEKGNDISETIALKSQQIKDSKLIEAREKGSKMTVTILIPTVIFKIFPILAIMFIPIILQISQFL